MLICLRQVVGFVLYCEHICGGLTEKGRLFACGEMDTGKLGCDPDADIDHFSPQVVDISDQVMAVSCGHNHTVAVTGHWLIIFMHLLLSLLLSNDN